MRPLIFSLIITFLLAIPDTVNAQSAVNNGSPKQKIEILSAKELKNATVNGEDARELVGNVKMRQGKVVMECDRALFYNKRNAVDAFGSVHINEADSSHIYSDSLKYDGETKKAEFFGNVRLQNPQLELKTDYLIYNLETKAASYYNGGEVIGRDLKVISTKGYYFNDSKNAFFRDSVVVISSNYELYSDTLQYNTETEVTTFFGPTNIISKENTIYCESGWYNTINDKSSFGKNTVLESDGQILKTDSLYYDQGVGMGKAFYWFEWIDTAMGVTMTGKRADFNKNNDEVMATDSAMMVYIMEGDSLYLVGDTLLSREDSAGFKELYAYYRVRIYKSDLQGICDSLAFTFRDSLMRMYDDPILWNGPNQMTGDTIIMTIENQRLSKVELFPKGFIVNESAPEVYNQIKGRHIYGFFKDNTLDKMLVNGNGESSYYGKDEDNAFVGLNVAKCSDMWIYLVDGEVDRIKFLSKPDATFHPIQRIRPKDFLLKDFRWLDSKRPKSKEDLFTLYPDAIELPVEDIELPIDSLYPTPTDTIAPVGLEIKE